MLWILLLFLLKPKHAHSEGIISSDIESIDSILQSFQTISQSSCSKNAVKDILPDCIKGFDILPQQKRALAIKLSICEFEASGVNFPIECSSQSMHNLCIERLKSSPQFWTTYSGNYHHLQLICYQESLPHEKDQIIDLFSTITGLYKKLVVYMENIDSNFEETGNQFLSKIEKFIESFQSDLEKALQDEIKKHSEIIKSNFEGLNSYFHEENSRVMGNVWTDLINLQLEFGELSNTNDDLSFNLKNFMASSLESTNEILNNIEKISLSSFEIERINQLQQDSLVDTLELISETQNYISGDFKDSLSIISENIALEVYDSFHVLDDILYESLGKLDLQVSSIQAKLEETDGLLSNFSTKLDNTLKFFVNSTQLVSFFTWEDYKLSELLIGCFRNDQMFLFWTILATLIFIVVRFVVTHKLFLVILPLLLFGVGAYLGLGVFNGFVALSKHYISLSR